MSRFDTLLGASAPVIDHPSFGPVRASGRVGKGRWNWDALELIETRHGHADLSFEAGPDGPGSAHEVQLAALSDRLDLLTVAATPEIKSALANVLELSPDSPCTELEWEGAHLTGEEGTFRLNYACERWPDAMITVRFERWKPGLVQIED